jgi:hypothetical protein
MLYEGEKSDPSVLQINSVENYISYHVVSLLEKLRKDDLLPKLNVVILGCTHYPFYTQNFRDKFKEMYNYSENEKYVYRDFISENLIFIDPAINTAEELFQYLSQKNMFAERDIFESEFYISLPNLLNSSIVFSDTQNFTYEYKYGRKEGEIQQYVKRVPFNNYNISHDVEEMLKCSTPLTYDLIKKFYYRHKN